jgi:hypothetical protein
MAKPEPEGEMTEREAQAFLDDLRRQAAAWRKRLADPSVQAQIRAKKLAVSPLVTQLLEMFPEDERPSASPPTSAK